MWVFRYMCVCLFKGILEFSSFFLQQKKKCREYQKQCTSYCSLGRGYIKRCLYNDSVRERGM